MRQNRTTGKPGTMFSNVIDDFMTFILKYFPERQLYLRSGGEVSYHTLGTRTQVGAVTAI